MFLKHFLKNFGIWGDFYQILAKDDRHDCQNCIPCVDRNFLRNTFLRKNPHLLVWTLSEKSAKCRQKTVVKVVATAFYLSTKNRTTKNMFFFQENTIFKKLWVVSQFFWFFRKEFCEHSPNCILRVPLYNWRKNVCFLKSFFWIFLDSWVKKESDCCREWYGKFVKTAIYL